MNKRFKKGMVLFLALIMTITTSLSVFATENGAATAKKAKAEASYSMFKIAEDAVVYVNSDGSMTAEITYNGSSFLKMYLGTAEEAESGDTAKPYEAEMVEEKVYKYTIPLEALDVEFNAAVLSSKGSWKDNTLKISLVEGTEEPSTSEEPETPTTPTEPETPAVIPADGVYTIEVESDASMFKVVACTLTVENQKMTAKIALSGTGYDYLFPGKAEDASVDKAIPYTTDEEGRYAYEFQIASLEKEIAVAAHSAKKDTWYDRNLTFKSETLAPVTEDSGSEGTTEDNKTDDKTTTEDNKTDDNTTTGNNSGTANNNTNSNGELTEEGIKNLENSTQKGEVKDGTYTPSFGFTGGTGKTTISCKKVVVKNGKATATIVFSSSAYNWVKVNGTKYDNQNKGGNSTFVIPVTLNGKTNITAQTTAMSTPHEIDYVLYCYVDGTVVKTSGSSSNTSSSDAIDLTGETENTSEEEESVSETNGWGAYDSTGSSTSDQPIQVTVNQPSSIPVIVLCVLTGILDAYVIGISIFFFIRWRKNKKKGA